jgi:hypothetical protein
MNCCNPYFHKSTALTAGETAVEITVTNSTNISSLDCFELVLCQCPSEVVTGEPLPFTINVNGTAVNLLNKYSLPIYTNRLKPRKRYFGAYVAEGATPYVILFNTPCDPQFATA